MKTLKIEIEIESEFKVNRKQLIKTLIKRLNSELNRAFKRGGYIKRGDNEKLFLRVSKMHQSLENLEFKLKNL